uniref:Uncharacterized protein n=1 Tax=Physcomitrium patens TaxID=3218 RepID=A0A2K1JTK7_PHYPA|nr:hypothetical protein PHYPA_014628 [Physcomitrium patens]
MGLAKQQPLFHERSQNGVICRDPQHSSVDLQDFAFALVHYSANLSLNGIVVTYTLKIHERWVVCFERVNVLLMFRE